MAADSSAREPSPDDVLFLKAAARWKLAARDLIDVVEWLARVPPRDRAFRDRPEPPNADAIMTDAVFLVAWLARNCPKADANAILEVAEAAARVVRSARHRPRDLVAFDAMVERAVAVVNVGEDVVYRRRYEAEAVAAPRAVRGKRSAAPGEATAKLAAAMAKHHDFDGRGCLNWEPIGVRALARLAGVSAGAAVAFFSARFSGGWKEYRAVCVNRARHAALIGWLATLSGEARFRERGLGAPDDLVE